jgi:hypothetical protein
LIPVACVRQVLRAEEVSSGMRGGHAAKYCHTPANDR